MSFIKLGEALRSFSGDADAAAASMGALAAATETASGSLGSYVTYADNATKAAEKTKEAMKTGQEQADELMKLFDEVVKKNGPITAYMQGLIGQFKEGLINGDQFAKMLFQLLPQLQHLISLLATEGIVLGDAQKMAGELAKLAEAIDAALGR